MKSTRFSRPKGHFGTSLTFAMPFGLIAGFAAWCIHKPHLALGLILYGILVRILLAAVVGAAVVNERHLLRIALLYPLRDLLGFFYWAASYTSSLVVWRNQVYRLTKNGFMLPVADTPQPEHEQAMTA